MGRAAAAILFLALCGVAEGQDATALYAQNCSLCHQSAGTGLPGQFPRLAGRVAAISRRPAGRAYLIDVLTYGMSGTIHVDSEEILGVMPPFAALPDEIVAQILSYVQTLGDGGPPPAPTPFSTAEVAAARAKPPKSPDEVQAERHALQAAKILE